MFDNDFINISSIHYGDSMINKRGEYIRNAVLDGPSLRPRLGPLDIRCLIFLSIVSPS